MTKIGCLCCFLFFPVYIFAQSSGSSLADQSVIILPGETTSVAFILKNRTSNNSKFTVDVHSSSVDIMPILKGGDVVIPKGGSTVFVVPIHISKSAKNGIYELRVNLRSADGKIKFFKKQEIKVLRRQEIKLSVISTPKFLHAGEKIKVSFLLENHGNTTEKIHIESNAKVVDTAKVFVLEPGDMRLINIQKKTLEKMVENQEFSIHLKALSKSSPQKQWNAYSSTMVMTSNPKKKDPFFRFPISVSLATIGARNRGHFQGGFQGEIYGKGVLYPEKNDLLEFRFVSPSPIDFNSFSDYEAYFVRYKNSSYSVHLGDKTYSSSYLTEYARFGRGAEVNYTLGQFTFGGFYNHPRYFGAIKDEFNVFTSIRFNENTELTAGYLLKLPQNQNQNEASRFNVFYETMHLPYLKAEFSPFKAVKLSTEVAYSKSEVTEGFGYRLHGQAALKNIRANFNYIITSPEFNGYFSNTTSISAQLNYRLFKHLSLSASFLQDAKNIKEDSLFLSAPYRKNLRVGARYQYKPDGSVSVYSGTRRYKDRLEPKQFDYKEQYAEIEVNQGVGFLTLNATAHFGNTSNFLSAFTGESTIYSANISAEKFNTTVNLFGSYAKTSRYQQLEQEQIYYGIRVLSRFSDKNYLSVFYQNAYRPEVYFSDRNLFEMSFHQQFLEQHEVELSGRYTLQRGELNTKDFVYSLRYTFHFGVPIRRIAEYTSLSGTVKSLDGSKIEGVRLRLGTHIAIVDAQGHYEFESLVPGEYYLDFDRSSLMLKQIPSIQFPVKLKLKNKHEGERIFNFGLTTAAAIHGIVQLSQLGTNREDTAPIIPTLMDKKKNESVLVEVSNGLETYRKLCDLNEAFNFTYLRPGRWNIHVYKNGLGERVSVETNTITVDLKPAEISQINLSVVEKPIEINYQKESIEVIYNE